MASALASTKSCPIPALCCSSTCKTSTTFFCLEQRNTDKHVQPSVIESKAEKGCLSLTRGAGVCSEAYVGFPSGFGSQPAAVMCFHPSCSQAVFECNRGGSSFKGSCMPLHQPLSPGLTAHQCCELAAGWQIVPGFSCETQH